MSGLTESKSPAREVIARMTAYTLELREAEVKLNQNESPVDFPAALKQRVLAALAERPWNRYPDFESSALRGALARACALQAENILVGNGSNELLAAAIATFVEPGTRVVLPKPTFTLYEKLVTVAGGTVVAVPIDPVTGRLPLEEMIAATGSNERTVVIVCSPNNPTGGILPPGGLEALRATGATILFDRAYGDFVPDTFPQLDDRLVVFSTFSKAWGLAALRVGWVASSAATCREIRKVKLPYSLNVVSEAIAEAALEAPAIRDANVALATGERARVAAAMRAIDGITPYPSYANFITFRVDGDAKELFDALWKSGVLIRDVSAAVPKSLRVSMGTTDENDRFLELLRALTGRIPAAATAEERNR